MPISKKIHFSLPPLFFPSLFFLMSSWINASWSVTQTGTQTVVSPAQKSSKVSARTEPRFFFWPVVLERFFQFSKLDHLFRQINPPGEMTCLLFIWSWLKMSEAKFATKYLIFPLDVLLRAFSLASLSFSWISSK